jgi:predicted Zn-dependent peptidase
MPFFLPQKKHLAKADAIQTAIRIGKRLFTKTHPDYCSITVLNTLLGGYFGSRLMSNIREDKGYTYGISSGIVSMKEGGYFIISTEVGSEVCDPAIHEIYREIGKLRTELVPLEELNLVKNYMLGSFLRSIDGAFAQIERFIAVEEYGLGLDFYRQYVDTIRSIDVKRLRDLANQYLQEDSFVELTAGKRE